MSAGVQSSPPCRRNYRGQFFHTVIRGRVVQFGQEEDQRLADQMPPQDISIAEDETFHPQCCLVGIEPVSNFILLEQYADRRDANTWDRCLNERLVALPITVVQVTSDQAKALIRHAECCLGAHHSPDLFHVQHETVKATGYLNVYFANYANATPDIDEPSGGGN